LPDTDAGRVLLVVPTYNEALNLPHLVPRILAAIPDVDIYVVDDGSPDGTGALAEQLGRDTGRVRVVHRTTKSGRGGAVLAGLKAARDAGAYEWFCEMDADLSHQPEELERLLTARDDADMVVGSRYLPGARIEGWSWRRKLWSRLSNRMIKSVLRVPMSDFTNGYRLYSRRAVDHLARQRLRETGYISLSEWAYALHRAGMRIRDVPTTFINRRLGTSNMSASEAIDALRGLIRMRRHLPDA
jgi:dolichol-phosphate mannosyltransferase